MNNKIGIYGWIVATALAALYFLDFKPQVITSERHNIVGRVKTPISMKLIYP